MAKKLLSYRFSYAAEEDVLSLRNFLISRSEEHFFPDLLHRIQKAICILREFPMLGIHREYFHAQIFPIPGTSYIIIFRLQKGVLEILRIYHTAQKWENQDLS